MRRNELPEVDAVAGGTDLVAGELPEVDAVIAACRSSREGLLTDVVETHVGVKLVFGELAAELVYSCARELETEQWLVVALKGPLKEHDVLVDQPIRG